MSHEIELEQAGVRQKPALGRGRLHPPEQLENCGHVSHASFEMFKLKWSRMHWQCVRRLAPRISVREKVGHASHDKDAFCSWYVWRGHNEHALPLSCANDPGAHTWQVR